MREALLVAQLHAAQVQHAILHRGQHLLPPPRMRALIQSGHDTKRQMQSAAGIADLRACDERRAVVETSGGSGTAGTLSDIFVNLAVFVRTRPKSLD